MPNRLEEAMSKGAGKVKAATARIKGLMGVFNQLAKEHAEAASIMKRALSTEEPTKQHDLWSKLRMELLAHERAEVTEVFPALELQAATRDMAAHHQKEAQDLEAAIDRVDQSDYGTHVWHERLQALEQFVKAHVDEEEDEIFPAAQETLEEGELDEMEAAFLEARKAAMTGVQ